MYIYKFYVHHTHTEPVLTTTTTLPHTNKNSKLQSVLEVEFDKLRERLTELAEAATDSDPLEGLAILTVMQQMLAPLPLGGSSASATSSPAVSPTGSSRSSLALGSSVAANAGRAAGAAGGEDSFLAEMLAALQQSLAGRFAKFVAEQEQWVVHQAPDIKRAGVLAPFAKFPVFVDRLALVRFFFHIWCRVNALPLMYIYI